MPLPRHDLAHFRGLAIIHRNRIAELEAERDKLKKQISSLGNTCDIVNNKIEQVLEENEHLTAQVERLKEVEALVAKQAEDAGLWFNAQYITEAGLQEALRQLHAVIEGKSPEKCARAVLSGEETTPVSKANALEQKVTVLTKALQFYADEWDGHAGDSGPGGNWPADPEWNPTSYLLEDGGQIARTALSDNEGKDS